MKLAIFDLDGTLLDTLGTLAHHCNHVLQSHGYPTHPVDSYRYFLGEGSRKLLQRTLPQGTDQETVDTLLQEYLSYYDEHLLGDTQPYPGIAPLLQAWQERGLCLAVLSNKPHPQTCKLIEHFFPRRFDLVFGQREGVPRKPDPAAAIEIMNTLGVSPQETIYLGDTSTDMQTGRSCGAYTVGVLWGFRPKEELEQYHPDKIVARPQELMDLCVSER